jgi:hypothetical protein
MPDVLPDPIEDYKKLFKAIKKANDVWFKSNEWFDYQTKWFSPDLPACSAVELRGNVFLAINECDVYMLEWAIDKLKNGWLIGAQLHTKKGGNNPRKKLEKVLKELNKVL